MRPGTRAVIALGAALLAPTAWPDVFVLGNGDRITGKLVFSGTKTFRVETPYGRLVIPKAKVERVVHDDGSEEVLNPPQATSKATAHPAHVVLVITGKAFWYAWDPPRGASVDTTLRLQVSLDEDVVATYVDGRVDPREIPGALVNSFAFGPEDAVAHPGEDSRVQPPEARPGRIVLKLDLPAGRPGARRLRVAYQVNEGSEAEPAWRDMAHATTDLELRPDAACFVQVHQDRGRMEFSGLGRRRMKNVETFRIETRPE